MGDRVSLLQSRQRKDIAVADTFLGRHAFLVGGGPSATPDILTRLQDASSVFALNDHGEPAAPFARFYLDDPVVVGRLTQNLPIYESPLVWKIMPINWANGMAGYPSVAFYRPRLSPLDPETFFEGDVWIGENPWDFPLVDGDFGIRCVMFPAIRLLHWLGVKRIYLVGADFPPGPTGPSPSNGGVVQDYFPRVASLLESLAPKFQSTGLDLYNCNPDSGLKAFPYMAFDDALKESVD